MTHPTDTANHSLQEQKTALERELSQLKETNAKEIQKLKHDLDEASKKPTTEPPKVIGSQLLTLVGHVQALREDLSRVKSSVSVLKQTTPKLSEAVRKRFLREFAGYREF